MMKIKWDGAAKPFTIRLVRQLDEFGDCEPEKLALASLIEEVRKQVGANRQAEIDDISKELVRVSVSRLDEREKRTQVERGTHSKPTKTFFGGVPKRRILKKWVVFAVAIGGLAALVLWAFLRRTLHHPNSLKESVSKWSTFPPASLRWALLRVSQVDLRTKDRSIRLLYRLFLWLRMR